MPKEAKSEAKSDGMDVENGSGAKVILHENFRHRCCRVLWSRVFLVDSSRNAWRG